MTISTRSESPFVSTLPGRYYYDPTIYALEQERIFSSMWVCVGRADAIPNPGSYQLVNVGQENIIVIRNRENILQAFLNVCRHRGARLCTEAQGQVKGSIQCRYHAWTYGLDGQLIGAPNVLDDERFERATFGLYRVALEIWEGLIWLNLADDPTPIASQLNGPLLERFSDLSDFARYGVGELHPGKHISYDIHCNWKLVLENFMECYHCGSLHPELCQLLPGYKGGQAYIDSDGAATLADGAEAFSMSGKSSHPPLPGLHPNEQRLYYGIVLEPNILLNLFGDHVLIHTVYPEAPDRTRVECDWLFHPATLTMDNFDPTDAVEIFDLINRQDWEVCELTQQGMTSKAYRTGGVYVPKEHHIRAFCDFVLQKLE